MSFVEANYTKRKSVHHGFLDGLAPWMTENNNGGTITTETTNGGRAVLSTGTTANGDRARIDLSSITPSIEGFEAVGLRCVFSLDGASTVAGDTITQIGFLNADVPGRVYHNINGELASLHGTLRVSSATGDNNVTVRDRRSTSIIETELLWDTEDNIVYHRYEDSYSGKADGSVTTVPDPTLDYTPKIQHATNNTNAEQVMYLYDVELSYYNRDVQ